MVLLCRIYASTARWPERGGTWPMSNDYTIVQMWDHGGPGSASYQANEEYRDHVRAMARLRDLPPSPDLSNRARAKPGVP